MTRKYHLQKIGAHITENKARIDFFYDKNISHMFEEILNEYNAIIKRDLPIKTDFSDLENQPRFWEIEGFSRVPCGGTHVRSTREVGFVTLKMLIVGAAMRKLVHIIYGVLKTNRPFDPEWAKRFT